MILQAPAVPWAWAMFCRASWQELSGSPLCWLSERELKHGGKGLARIKPYLRTLVVAEAAASVSSGLVCGPAKMVEFTGLRGDRRTGRSLVLGCGSTGTKCGPTCLLNFALARERWAAREILVWKYPSAVQAFKGWERRASVEHPRVPLLLVVLSSPQLLIPHPHRSPPLLLRLSRPPSSSACIDSRVVSVRLLPLPRGLAGSLFPIRQDLGTHPHLNRYLWLVAGSCSIPMTSFKAA